MSLPELGLRVLCWLDWVRGISAGVVLSSAWDGWFVAAFFGGRPRFLGAMAGVWSVSNEIGGGGLLFADFGSLRGLLRGVDVFGGGGTVSVGVRSNAWPPRRCPIVARFAVVGGFPLGVCFFGL